MADTIGIDKDIPLLNEPIVQADSSNTSTTPTTPTTPLSPIIGTKRLSDTNTNADTRNVNRESRGGRKRKTRKNKRIIM